MPTTNAPVVLITGASSGIGRACAAYLHAQGCQVYGTSRHAGPLDNQQSAGNNHLMAMDVDDDASVEAGVRAIVEREGRIDVAINNAGFGIAGAVEDTSIEEAKAQFETNFFGTLRVCQAVLPVMREQGSGLIINVSSIGGVVSLPFQGLYCASKFAMEGLTETLRMEAKPFGVRVSLLEPGDFNTGFTAQRRRTAAAMTHPAYRDRLERTLAVVERDERGGPPPDQVARLVHRIMRQRHPGLRYTTGMLFERVVPALKVIIPPGIFEWGLMGYYRMR